jgi:hypothetical protein
LLERHRSVGERLVHDVLGGQAAIVVEDKVRYRWVWHRCLEGPDCRVHFGVGTEVAVHELGDERDKLGAGHSGRLSAYSGVLHSLTIDLMNFLAPGNTGRMKSSATRARPDSTALMIIQFRWLSAYGLPTAAVAETATSTASAAANNQRKPFTNRQ